MKPMKKEDMPKLIMLGILAVAVLGYIIFEAATGMGSPRAAAAPTPGPTPAAVASNGGIAPGAPGVAGAAAAPGAAAAGDPAAGSPELDFARLGPPSGGRDPFVASGPAAATPAPPPAPAPARPLPSVVQARPNLVSLIGATAGAGGLALSGGTGSGGHPVSPMPVVTPTPAPPAWSVTGIVLADRDPDGVKRGNDVAILSGNGDDRKFVTVGDPVGNGYVVTGVHAYGVDVRLGDHITTIRLASTTSSPAASTPAPGASGGTFGVTTRAK